MMQTRVYNDTKPYMCETCNKTFYKIGYLKCHERTHIADKLYTCNLCNRKFVRRHNLDVHMRTHTGEKPFKCNSCDKAFAQKFCLDNHIRTHTGEKPYKCNFCHQVFMWRDTLKRHLKTHGAENSCNFQLPTQRLTHLDDHNYHINSGQKPYKSVLCQSLVSSMTERCYDSTSCKTFNIYTRDNSCFTENLFAENQYNGNICHKRSRNINDVKGHTKVHDGRKLHKCERCNKVFARSETLKFHVRIHTGEKPYNCHLCDKACVAKDVLKRHIRTHTGEKPYKCNICQKVFRERTHLRNHLKAHNREKSYKCKFCSIAFTDVGDLNFHLAKHYVEKSNKSKLICQTAMVKMAERFHDHTSSTRFTMCAGDENELPTTVNPKVFSSVRSINSSPRQNHYSGHRSIITADINPFVVRTYGCGICDEMFEIEKEFIRHCYNHYDIPWKDTL